MELQTRLERRGARLLKSILPELAAIAGVGYFGAEWLPDREGYVLWMPVRDHWRSAARTVITDTELENLARPDGDGGHSWRQVPERILESLYLAEHRWRKRDLRYQA